MSGYSIIGSDGSRLSPEEAQLLAFIAARESGRLDEQAYVGAALPLLFGPSVSSATRSRAMSPALTAALTQGNRFMGAGGAIAASVSSPNGTGYAVPARIGPTREVVQGIFDGVSIAAGATRDLTFNATMVFKPTRLMLGPSMAPVFAINDIRVSNDSLFLNTGRVPGEVFLPESVGASALKRRTAQPGTPVIVSVVNIDVQPHVFNAALFGEAADFDGCGT